MLERRPLLTASVAGRDGADGQRAIRFAFVHGWHLVLVAALRGSEDSLRQSLGVVLGVEPERAADGAQAVAGGHLYHTAPGQYWVVADSAALIERVAHAVDASVGTCTPLTHSRVRIAISGAHVPGLLAKGIAVDMDPAAFPVGRFVQAGLHHSGVLLHRTAADRYEIYLPRTFANSLWEWLTDAARPLGYNVTSEGDASAP
jgi:sarcosine oxidase subunit gamma